MINPLKRSGKYSLFLIAILLVFVWGMETPPGVLGKADAIGYAVCHRIDVRSFHLGVRQLPLCVRCTGQYVGAMLGLVFQALVARRRSGFPTKGVLAVMGVFALAYAVDGLNSYLYLPPFLKLFPHLPHLYEPSNLLRLLTGTGIGLVIALALYPAFVGTVVTHPDPRPAVGSSKALLALITLGLLVDLLILTGSPLVLYPAALVSAIGVIILLSLAYTIAILRIFKKEKPFTHFSQVILPVCAGFVVTMAQIALFDLVRMLITGTWSGFTFG